MLRNGSPTRGTRRSRSEIVAALKERGIFLLKGAVTEVVEKLHSSEATIYRYLNEVEEMEKAER